MEAALFVAAVAAAARAFVVVVASVAGDVAPSAACDPGPHSAAPCADPHDPAFAGVFVGRDPVSSRASPALAGISGRGSILRSCARTGVALQEDPWDAQPERPSFQGETQHFRSRQSRGRDQGAGHMLPRPFWREQRCGTPPAG